MRPDRRVLRHVRHIAFVTAAGIAREIDDDGQIAGVICAGKTALVTRPFKMIVADVIGASLEQRHGHRHFQRLAHHLDVAVEQLVLQVLGTGRDDDLAAGEQGRNQISEGLAGAGAGFGHQYGVFADRGGDSVGHFDLAFAYAKTLHCLCQRTAV